MGEDFTQPERVELGRGWQESEKLASQSGNWLKLESGQATELVPIGEPAVFEATFERDGKSEVSKRWSIDVYVPRDERILTWEMSKTTFGALKRQREIRGKRFPYSVFRVERQGSALLTKYSVDFVDALDGEALDKLNAQLINLGIAPVGVGAAPF